MYVVLIQALYKYLVWYLNMNIIIGETYKPFFHTYHTLVIYVDVYLFFCIYRCVRLLYAVCLPQQASLRSAAYVFQTSRCVCMYICVSDHIDAINF